MLYGIFGVKTSGIEQMMYNQWYERFRDLLSAYRAKENLLNHVNTATGSLSLLAPLSVLWIGAHMIMDGQLTLGGMIAFFSISNQFFGLSSSIVNTVNSFFLTESFLRRIQDVLDAKEEPVCEKPIRLSTLRGEIELQNVSFAYTKFSPPAVKNVSLKILPGQKVPLVGKSGSGKSTLARLILGLYVPTEGRILFDGHDLRTLDKPSLRKHIGAVPQDDMLFNRTILENITLLKPDASMEEVTEAAKIAQIHDEIMKMPMNYHTMISELGMNISGGQRQRITLARALVHKPCRRLTKLSSVLSPMPARERPGRTGVTTRSPRSRILNGNTLFFAGDVKYTLHNDKKMIQFSRRLFKEGEAEVKNKGVLRNRLTVLRAEKGWTQQEVANRLGISRQTVHSVENNKFVPSVLLAFRIARLFGKNVEEVFQYTEEGEDLQ